MGLMFNNTPLDQKTLTDWWGAGKTPDEIASHMQTSNITGTADDIAGAIRTASSGTSNVTGNDISSWIGQNSKYAGLLKQPTPLPAPTPAPAPAPRPTVGLGFNGTPFSEQELKDWWGAGKTPEEIASYMQMNGIKGTPNEIATAIRTAAGGGPTSAAGIMTWLGENPHYANVLSGSTVGAEALPKERNVATSVADATTTIPTTHYQAERWTPTGDALVENRIANLLNQDNPYMQAARTSGLQTAQARGLLNSSMAGEAAQAAAIKAAFPIASQDATTYTNAGLANQTAANNAGQFNAGASNAANVLSSELASREGIAKETQASQERMSALNAASTAEATQLAAMGSVMAQIMVRNNEAINAINLSDLPVEAKQSQIQQIEVGTRNASAAALAVYQVNIDDILGTSFGVY